MASRDQKPVTLTVNGERWSALRSTLADCGSDSRVYTVRVSDEGGTIISFGDGVHGKSLPHGGRLSLTIAPETPLPVALERTAGESTPDQALWTVIRKRTDATELEFYAPCEDPGAQPGEEPSRATARWRLAALILAALLLALTLWR
jgi:hypothetical protein